jgi:hypothetical protein
MHFLVLGQGATMDTKGMVRTRPERFGTRGSQRNRPGFPSVTVWWCGAGRNFLSSTNFNRCASQYGLTYFTGERGVQAAEVRTDAKLHFHQI